MLLHTAPVVSDVHELVNIMNGVSAASVLDDHIRSFAVFIEYSTAPATGMALKHYLITCQQPHQTSKSGCLAPRPPPPHPTPPNTHIRCHLTVQVLRESKGTAKTWAPSKSASHVMLTTTVL